MAEIQSTRGGLRGHRGRRRGRSNAGLSGAATQARRGVGAAGGGHAKEPEKIRREMFDEIYAKLNETELGDENKYQETLSNCIIDPDTEHFTILHWIINQVGVLVPEESEGERRIQAAERMMELALEYKETLISEVGKDGRNETALQTAVGSSKSRVRSLAKKMCAGGAKSAAVRKAISQYNWRGENCLHLAIARDADLAMELIDMADVAAFLQKRHERMDDVKVPDGGNTPLHDAVKFAMDRFVFEQPECAAPEKDGTLCPECEAMESAYEHVNRAMELVRSLVNRCDKALTYKNGEDESPYMYHLRTKHDFYSKRADTEIHPKSDHGTGVPTANLAAISRGGRSTAAVTSAVASACTRSLNDAAADKMLGYMVESAFAIGTFEDACGCFFGKTPGKSLSRPTTCRSDDLLPEQVLQLTAKYRQGRQKRASSAWLPYYVDVAQNLQATHLRRHRCTIAGRSRDWVF